MKKLFIILLINLCFLYGCACPDTATCDHNGQISELEAQLSSLQASKSESDRQIQALLDQIARLEAQDTPSPPQTTPPDDDEQSEAVGFTYTVLGDEATVTGYVGDEKDIVIPASIDGYVVVAVGDRAFADTDIKSVIISENVRSIGWFAFDGCVKLKSITVPSSVTSIGYCAFGNAQTGATVYCHAGSFALEYAKSFGLSYTVI